jgi:hypothetical protein
MSDQQQQRFPLSWPTGWKRTPRHQRQRAAFSASGVQTVDRGNGQIERVRTTRALTVADALKRVSAELSRLGATREILSTNVVLRIDGLPRSGQPEPDDPGAAVYFHLKGQPRCLACDRWNRVADNIAAVAQHIDALRRIDRYGVGTMEQAFAGYAQLPANTAANWRDVFGFKDDQRVTWAEVEDAFRELARAAHPDAGGTHEQMARLSEAKAFARKELHP